MWTGTHTLIKWSSLRPHRRTPTHTHWQAALQLNKLTRRLREALKSMQRKMNVKQCKSRLRFELNFASLLTALLASILRTWASVCGWVSQCANFSIACIIKILRIRSVQLHLLMLHRAALHWALSTAKHSERHKSFCTRRQRRARHNGHTQQSQQSGAALDCLGYNLRSVDLAEAATETQHALLGPVQAVLGSGSS